MIPCHRVEEPLSRDLHLFKSRRVFMLLWGFSASLLNFADGFSIYSFKKARLDNAY